MENFIYFIKSKTLKILLFIGAEVLSSVIVSIDQESFFLFWAVIAFGMTLYGFSDLGSSKYAPFTNKNQYSNMMLHELEQKHARLKEFAVKAEDFPIVSIGAFIVNLIIFLIV